MIKINASQVRQFEHRLELLNSRGLLFAEIEAVNKAAEQTRLNAKRDLPRRMTLRNKWTERSIQSQKAHRERLEATTGSVMGYMETQQNGATIHANGSHGVDIPTAAASGEGRAGERKKMVRKPNRMTSIVLNRQNRARSSTVTNRKRRNAYAVRQAAAGGSRYVFLELQKRKGIFRVYGGKRNPRIEMMHDLTRKSVRVPSNPWLTDAAAGPTRELPAYYGVALARQLKRLR